MRMKKSFLVLMLLSMVVRTLAGDIFHAGPQSRDDWRGSWLSVPVTGIVGYSRSFTLAGDIRDARLYIAYAGCYELSLNDERVGPLQVSSGTSRIPEHMYYYDTYTVRNQLHAGTNTIRISQLLSGSQRGLQVNLYVRYRDGHDELVTTDSLWKVSSVDHGSIRPEMVHPVQTILPNPTQQFVELESDSYIPPSTFRKKGNVVFLSFSQPVCGNFWIPIKKNLPKGYQVVYTLESPATREFYRQVASIVEPNASHTWTSTGSDSGTFIHPRFQPWYCQSIRIHGLPDLTEDDIIVQEEHDYLLPTLTFHSSDSVLNRRFEEEKASVLRAHQQGYTRYPDQPWRNSILFDEEKTWQRWLQEHPADEHESEVRAILSQIYGVNVQSSSASVSGQSEPSIIPTEVPDLSSGIGLSSGAVIATFPDSLSSCDITFDSKSGTITSQYHRDGTHLTWRIDFPDDSPITYYHRGKRFTATHSPVILEEK